MIWIPQMKQWNNKGNNETKPIVMNMTTVNMLINIFGQKVSDITLLYCSGNWLIATSTQKLFFVFGSHCVTFWVIWPKPYFCFIFFDSIHSWHNITGVTSDGFGQWKYGIWPIVEVSYIRIMAQYELIGYCSISNGCLQ